ncbi:MAG: O-antigen ligase family protein [Roseobacter sp.]
MALAAVAAMLAVALGQVSRRFLILAVGLVGWCAVGLLIRDLRAALLFLLPLAVSYNRQYYSFDAVFGDWGYAGLYWVPADALLFLILIVSLWRTANRQNKEPVFNLSGVVLPFFAFICVMALSAVNSAEPVPAMIETVRLLKLLIILLFLMSIMTIRNATALLLGLAAMIGLQAALGAVQFVLGAGGAGLSNLSAQSGEMARRGTGTLGHPNFYAPFLLTIVPGFVAMALGMQNSWGRAAAALTAFSGLIAIVVSQSRMALAALALSLVFVALHLAIRRITSPMRVIGGAAVITVLLTLMALPIADKIHDRLTGDFGASISFRADYNNAAMSMWQSHPLLGIGPNRFVAELGPYAPEIKYINDQLEEFRTQANARTAAPVHNLYLLVLAEVGAIGSAAFVVLLAMSGREFWKAGSVTPDRPVGLIFVGVFWGFVGVLIQQTTDFSFWWDHHLYLFVILLALAAHVRSLFADREGRAA